MVKHMRESWKKLGEMFVKIISVNMGKKYVGLLYRNGYMYKLGNFIACSNFISSL
jgi:hypothetical protein